MSQFDYEPPTARQPRHRERRATTLFYRWFPLLMIILIAALLIMAQGR